jgi:hypothetical protein
LFRNFVSRNILATKCSDKMKAMIETITETERKVINILVAYGDAPNAYTEPLSAVERAMGWATTDTKAFVRSLINRNLIRADTRERLGTSYRSRWHWEEVTD